MVMCNCVIAGFLCKLLNLSVDRYLLGRSSYVHTIGEGCLLFVLFHVDGNVPQRQAMTEKYESIPIHVVLVIKN